MKYCPETVLVQSAFVLAARKYDLTSASGNQTTEAVEIIRQALREVSNGLDYGRQQQTFQPIEVNTLLYKVHAWIYWTWRKGLGILPEGTYFSEFPPLPLVGTGLYVEVVKTMQWEALMIECLLFSGSCELTTCLHELTLQITQDLSDGDVNIFVMLFNNFLNKTSKPADKDDGSATEARLPELLLTGLRVVHPKINNPKIQIVIVKRIIEFIYHGIADSKVLDDNHPVLDSPDNSQTLDPLVNITTRSFSRYRFLEKIPSATKLEKLDANELKKLCHDLSNKLNVENGSVSTVDNSMPLDAAQECQVTHAADNTVTGKSLQCVSLGTHDAFIEFLYCLFTEHWKETCNWSTCCHDNGDVSQLEDTSWHPLHQWIVGLFAALNKVITREEGTSHCRSTKLMHQGLVGYIEKFATNSDHKFILETASCTADQTIKLDNPAENFIAMTGLESSLCCRFPLSRDQFSDSLWRVHHRLEGYKACMDWLLAAEEFYNEPDWLECIKSNALEMCSKRQATMMIDILCVQYQMIDSDDTTASSVYRELREVLQQLFMSVADVDKEEIIEYAFRMSISVTGDAAQNTVFFHPCHPDDDKRTLLQDMRVTFNRLVDKEDAALDTSINIIAKHFLISLPLTLTSAIQTAVQYGRTHTICKILQRLHSMCRLSSCEGEPPLLCSMLQIQAAQVTSPQEENNLLNFVELLLQPFKTNGLLMTHKPILAITDLVKTCVLPYLNRHGNQDGISIFIALKLLKSSLTAISFNQSEDRTFVLKYLIPIILCLCKLLHGCKVCWEGLDPVPSPVEVVHLRSLVLAVLGVAVHVVVRVYQFGMTGLELPVQWLCSKVKMLDWPLSLHLTPLVEAVLPVVIPTAIPACLFDVCNLPTDVWTSLSVPDDDPVCCLFKCVSVSDSIAEKISKAPISDRLIQTGCDKSIVNNLIKVMSYCTASEFHRIVNVCRLCLLQSPSDNVCSMSNLLREVLTKLASPCCSSWATPRVLVHVIKHYVVVVKQMCAETMETRNQKSNDVIAAVIIDVCHVMCTLPDDVTHQLFVLALDLVSMVTVNDELRQSVSKLPQPVYRDALLQKLSNP